MIYSRSQTSLNVYNEAMQKWAAENPDFAKFGWGPSVNAEKWNGRHAMFGWVVICASAYAHGHNIIPNADMHLDVKEWGSLARIMGTETITNERAVILMANVHAFLMGIAATIAPLPFWDPLFLEEGQKGKDGYGYLPAFKFGLTPEAEMINGRLAMVGITAVIGAAAGEGKSIIDVTNEWLGHAYY
jgi:hypothetical protein